MTRDQRWCSSAVTVTQRWLGGDNIETAAQVEEQHSAEIALWLLVEIMSLLGSQAALLPPGALDGPVTREDCVFLISITQWCQMKVLVRAYLHSGHIKYSCMDLLSHNKGHCWTCPSALLGSGTDNKPGLGC